MKSYKEIEKKIHNLPPHLLEELEDFIDFLIHKKTASKEKENKLKQDWAGALKEYSDQYTSLELQRKSLEWRNK